MMGKSERYPSFFANKSIHFAQYYSIVLTVIIVFSRKKVVSYKENPHINDFHLD